MVGDDDVLIHLRDGVNVVQHTPQNGALPYFEEGFGEVLGKFPQAGSVAGCYYYVFHMRYTRFARYDKQLNEPCSVVALAEIDLESVFVLRKTGEVFFCYFFLYAFLLGGIH